MAAEINVRTRERILDGAMAAIARHGLAKLGMSDVSASAGVSRGTLYRYFPNREELLQSLATFESQRFQERMVTALRRAPSDASRLEVALQLVTNYVAEHPAIRRVIETEPAFVLAYLRKELPNLCAVIGAFLAPLLRETEPVRQRLVTTEQLVDWLTRVMISAVLFPDSNPNRMAHGLTAVYRWLSGAHAAPKRRPTRKERS